MTSTNQGYPTTDDTASMTDEDYTSVLQDELTALRAENARLRAALERIASNESEDRDDCPHCIATAALTGAPDAGGAR